MAPIVEVTLSWLLKNAKGRDTKCFYNRPAFAKHPEQTIEVTLPDCGPTDAQFGMDFQCWSGWLPPAISDKVKQWLLVSEDPDTPLPTPIAHGIFGGIPPSKTSVEAKDFKIDDESKALLKGGFHYGVTRRGVPIPLRPLMNHGPHRYFYEVIVLGEPLDPKLLNSKATREQVADAIVGKVLG
ncbi:hypothetical protein B0H14DRAFT_2951243 [Mycena olivaceomarginata]|nr:hypothetical protein B0H14DRAFT_2951243 [Mycena olivaceomarginata]